jgi:hypothetical protein
MQTMVDPRGRLRASAAIRADVIGTVCEIEALD